MHKRLLWLIEALTQHELDGILVSTPENRRYLSGFTGSAGYLLISKNQAELATDSWYIEQATEQAEDFRVVPAQAEWNWLVKSLKKSRLQRLGFESKHLPVAAHQQILESISREPTLTGVSLVTTSEIIEDLRECKDHQELVFLQRAIASSDSAMDAVCPTLREGLTEREVAWRMEQAMREFGAEGISFNTIVASGPNGATPHHSPTDRAIAQGEPIVIDMGAKNGGYCSEISRTIMLGPVDETFRNIYDIVLGAQLTAIAIVRPGMTGGECDSLSRSVIQEAGHSDNFGHSSGYGVGLAMKEAPRVGLDSDDTLAIGTVFTVEPSIYIPAWGGVRIQDIVLLEQYGATPLSKARK